MKWFYPIPADASVNFTSSTYPVNEGDGTVQVCLSLYDIPTERLECEIEVYLATTDGIKAGMLAFFFGVNMLHIALAKVRNALHVLQCESLALPLCNDISNNPDIVGLQMLY